MSTLRIYGIARTRAFRVLWIAKELDLDYEHIPLEIGAARDQPQRPSAGDRRRRLRLVGVARNHALSRQEAWPALSEHARRRGQGVAVEPVVGAGGRPRRQHLVAARRALTARGSRSATARRGAQGARAAIEGARRRACRALLPLGRGLLRCGYTRRRRLPQDVTHG